MSTLAPYDRTEDAKRFDETKQGVKGLVDSGITSIPRFFIHPPQVQEPLRHDGQSTVVVVRTIDLLGGVLVGPNRAKVVEEVSRASREVGLCQVVNHGIPLEVLERTLSGIRAFHEMDKEEKAKIYGRDKGDGTGVCFFSNLNLFQPRPACWRDTLQIKLSPHRPKLELIPEVCRNVILEWDRQATRVAELLMELLSEGLGLDAGRFKAMKLSESRIMLGQYYPRCPQPDLTLGIVPHSDNGILTMLLQDHVGGLQVKCDTEWVDVKPVPGALVIDVADMLQMMSNGEYKSTKHRVLANPSEEARVSAAVFFQTSDQSSLFGPFSELISHEKPALYRQFTPAECIARLYANDLGGKTLTEYFKL